MRPTSRSLAFRGASAATLAVLAVGGLAACSDDGSDDTATDATSQVAGLSAGLEDGAEVDPAEFVKTVTDGLEASTTAHITMSMELGSAGGMDAEGDIDYTTTPPQMAMSMSSPMAGGDLEVRMVDGIMYLSMGELTQGKFIKLDPSDPKSPLGSLGMDGMLDQMDPGQALKGMEDGISKVVFVGDEDGLDHYELTVDMAKMVDEMGTDLPDAAQSQLPDSVSYDLWLDDQGRFTRLSMDELPIAGTNASMEMNVSGWGEDVDISAPAEGDITEMPDMGSMMRGMTGASA